MGIGKYSPTVSRWYSMDQGWFEKHSDKDAWIDHDGYDQYGYHDVTGLDRAGYKEEDYYDGEWVVIDSETGKEEWIYTLYPQVYDDWASVPLPWEKK